VNIPNDLINFKLSETRKQLMLKLVTLRIETLIQYLWKQYTPYLRAGKGSRRISVGTIKKCLRRNPFQYNQEGVKQAKKLGFVHYEGFPDTDKVYTENVIEILSTINAVKDQIYKIFYDFGISI
jgi:hypothetical protein